MPRMVSIVIVGLMLLIAMALEVSPLAQRPDCSTDQRLDAVTRRREAIVRARNVNDRQAQQRATKARYATAAELGLKDENGFEMSVRTDADGYMVFIRDASDPCSSGVFSDQRGVIYDARPIR